MKVRPPLTILDANVWFDCFRRPDSEHIRMRVIRAARAKRIRLALVPIVLGELASGHREGVAIPREVVLRFAWNACAGRVTIISPRREEAEIYLRRQLREGELLADQDGELRAGAFSLEFAERIASDLRQVGREHRQNERARHEGTIEAMSREQLEADLGTPEARLAVIRSWAHDEIREKAAELGIERYSPPRAEKLPSFFANNAVHVERITRVLLEGRSRVHPGVADVTILIDTIACGRAILVTRDEPLLEVAARVHPLFPRFRASHANTWFGDL